MPSYLGYWHFGLEPAFYKPEMNLFNNEFRADFVVSDRENKKFVFIEFEDATEDSIFKLKSRRSNVANTSYEWASRYEHGLSQVIDWYYRMDDYERTHKFEEYFGHRLVSYTGLLVIGRDKFIQQAGLMQNRDILFEKSPKPLYLPRYSPDFNPIEMLWSVLFSLLSDSLNLRPYLRFMQFNRYCESFG